MTHSSNQRNSSHGQQQMHQAQVRPACHAFAARLAMQTYPIGYLAACDHVTVCSLSELPLKGVPADSEHNYVH
jgi:hypothetical protein